MLLTWRIFYKQQDDEETEEDEEEGTTPPVSLCVPWQMFVKEVANINTVLTYIWQRPPLVPSTQFLAWPWRPQTKRTAAPMILPNTWELAGPAKALIGTMSCTSRYSRIAFTVVHPSIKNCYSTTTSSASATMKWRQKARVRKRERVWPSTTLIHHQTIMRRFESCMASSTHNIKNAWHPYWLPGCGGMHTRFLVQNCVLFFV